MSRYRFVSTMKAESFPVEAACGVAEVSTSAYYQWLAKVAAGPTDAEWDETLLINEIRKVHDHLDDSYGSPRMTDELRSRGHCANHKRVERLMAENGIYARDGRRRKVRTTIPDVSAPPLPDLVGRRFAPGEPGERTCGDITYIPTDEGWLYLADVLDIGSRRIVGYAMDEHMPTELVAKALQMAVDLRGGDVEGMVFHHDRGPPSTCRGTSGPCAPDTRSPSPSGGSDRARTTRWQSRSGQRSSASWCTAVGSPRGLRRVGRSSPGSTTTTRCAGTPPSATFPPLSGSYASPAVVFKLHNNVSG